jgi:DNA-binding NtrC family response regulator
VGTEEDVSMNDFNAATGSEEALSSRGGQLGAILATTDPELAPRSVSSLPPRSAVEVVGKSSALLDIYRVIDRVSATHCTVLVTGESGTGKELVARAVHRSSARASGPFIAVNCGAIPENLLESELFGHARGAFTGAHANHKGYVASADGGTLFLDEIAELPLTLQVKLLRFLQTKEYTPVGDGRNHRSDVRIVAATNVDLEAAVREGRMREDLFYRLNVIQVTLPPLRDRGGDVRLLAEHFLERARHNLGREDILGFSDAALRVLEQYNWPGNVRELENAVERALLLCRGEYIEPRDLPTRILGLPVEQRGPVTKLADGGIDLRDAVESYENQLIRQALDATRWNKNQAAKMLGLNRTTLVEMLKRKRINAA